MTNCLNCQSASNTRILELSGGYCQSTCGIRYQHYVQAADYDMTNCERFDHLYQSAEEALVNCWGTSERFSCAKLCNFGFCLGCYPSTLEHYVWGQLDLVLGRVTDGPVSALEHWLKPAYAAYDRAMAII